MLIYIVVLYKNFQTHEHIWCDKYNVYCTLMIKSRRLNEQWQFAGCGCVVHIPAA